MAKQRPYDAGKIDAKWQRYWQTHGTFQAGVGAAKGGFYVLDMFPYPSGQGLHTGHALGYVGSDVVARYHRSLGYDVLHPMGFDSFGLPAEQYAQEVGAHPKVTTQENIRRYQAQLARLGLSFDWDRQVTTSDPAYYRWTQWLFLVMFHAWYDTAQRQARPIATLIAHLAKQGNATLQAACDPDTPVITAADWASMDASARQTFLGHYRLAYLAESHVNWCPALGTVLANDEVKDGLSERGGHPVVKKNMMQWSLRITAYADRLLEGLDTLHWSTALKDMQRHWIGRSVGAHVHFDIPNSAFDAPLTVFTTRPETIFGVTYLVLAPEHPYVDKILNTLPQENVHKEALQAYQAQALRLSERQRMQQHDHIQGVFTGLYATHPLTQQPLPIWVGDYVLGSYGTGAVMGVPAHDPRDAVFAQQYGLPVVKTIAGQGQDGQGTMVHTGMLDGMSVDAARTHVVELLRKRGLGQANVQYRLRDAVFSRQRYWGEPFPIYYQDGVPYPLDAQDLPLVLPPIDAYGPTQDGKPPLARVQGWTTEDGHPREYNTMPGWAGSSWYFFRYMDPHNQEAFASTDAMDYWGAVDLYVGGAEHATGHLLYARFLTKVLYDLGHVKIQEPFKRLLNQGMILATSHFVYRIQGTNQFVSHGKKDAYTTTPLRVDHRLVRKKVLDRQAFTQWRPDFRDATFILEEGKYICGEEIEKMSKSKHNAVNPDDVVAQYGADTFRLYMMFLGPITQSKPWSTEGIEGIARFLHKVWKLYHPQGSPQVHTTDTPPSAEAQRALHKAIQGVRESIERYTFNTAVSSLMICANELLALSCHAKEILEAYAKLLAPFAPHLAEELWERLGHPPSIIQAGMPTYDPTKVITQEQVYPVAIHGKKRAEITVPQGSPRDHVIQAACQHPALAKWLAGKKIRTVIVVPDKMVNIVLA